jgi:sulfonate transport system ATP-binding protein
VAARIFRVVIVTIKTYLTPLETSTGVAVVARNVRRTFNGRDVLRDVNLTVEADQFVALLGRSGTGKSTLLRILGGLDPDYEGQVLVPERRAVVFQEARLVPWLRVLSNVLLGLGSRGDIRATLRSRGLEALDEVGLAEHAQDWPLTLSGGEAQRVALARALVREPQLMLLDEPFGALDALTRIKMHALLQRLCVRHHPAVLLVTHDVDEAILLADRIVVLVDGAIAFDAEVTVAKPRSRGDVNFLALRSRLLSELGVDESAPIPPAPLPHLVRPGGAVPIMPAQSFDSLPNDFDNKEIFQ